MKDVSHLEAYVSEAVVNGSSVWFELEAWNEDCDDASCSDVPIEIPATRSSSLPKPMAGDMLPLYEVTSGNGSAASDRFGWNVSWAGDVNNDGIDDVIVGAPYVTYGGNSECGA
ncbi:MAG: FG-GAP repeat protein, partial [Gammaproteobacteria bacterium]|nr:FG-GAP repeat protein [Gammaproteobacteria bacterium]